MLSDRFFGEFSLRSFAACVCVYVCVCVCVRAKVACVCVAAGPGEWCEAVLVIGR